MVWRRQGIEGGEKDRRVATAGEMADNGKDNGRRGEMGFGLGGEIKEDLRRMLESKASAGEKSEAAAEARAMLGAWSALIALCASGERGWRSEATRSAADALLEAIGSKGRETALSDAALELARMDSPSGIAWAFGKGKRIEAPGKHGWSRICLVESFAPRALEEIEARGALREDGRFWKKRSGEEGHVQQSHPILHALEWELSGRSGEDVEKAIATLKKAGVGHSQAKSYRSGMLRHAIAGSAMALDFCEELGIEPQEFGEHGADALKEGLWSALENGGAMGWIRKIQDGGGWAGALGERSPLGALMEQAIPENGDEFDSEDWMIEALARHLQKNPEGGFCGKMRPEEAMAGIERLSRMEIEEGAAVSDLRRELEKQAIGGSSETPSKKAMRKARKA